VTHAVTLAVWAALGALLLVGEALSHAPRHRVRGLWSLAAPLLARTPTRVALLFGWMWLGWHLFAR